MKIPKYYVIIVFVCYLILVTVLSLVNLSKDLSSLGIKNIDKVIHFGFYLGLNVLVLMIIHLYARKEKIIYIAGITLGCILYGIAIEFIQEYVGRNFDIGDIIANCSGAVFGVILYYSLRSKADKFLL